MQFPCRFQKFLKGTLFHCQKYADQKYLWSSRTSSEPSKSIIKEDVKKLAMGNNEAIQP